jgi:hypothetical protein
LSVYGKYGIPYSMQYYSDALTVAMQTPNVNSIKKRSQNSNARIPFVIVFTVFYDFAFLLTLLRSDYIALHY